MGRKSAISEQFIDDHLVRFTRFELVPVPNLAGAAYRRDAGIEPKVINRGGVDMSFVEVELR